MYIQLWNDDKRNQILTFLNARNNSIYFYRYSDTTYLKRITFEREGANAIMSAAAYYIKSPVPFMFLIALLLKWLDGAFGKGTQQSYFAGTKRTKNGR